MDYNVYFAGLFDGEGCVRIGRYIDNRVNKLAYNMYVDITLTDIEPLLLAKSIFKGQLHAYAPRSDNRSRIYKWQLASRQAYAFLKAIEPYSIIKLKQIQLCMRFQEECKGKPNQKISEENQNLRDYIHDEVKKLKRIKTYWEAE